MKELLAVARYEFIMQTRRAAFWISTLLVLAIEIWDTFPSDYNFHRLNNLSNHYYTASKIAEQGGELLLIIAVFLVGDRILRDKKVRTSEVIMAAPVTQTSYVLGKYLGNLAAALLMPAILILVSAVVQGVLNSSHFTLTPYFLAFCLISIPSMSFVTGLSISVPSAFGGVKVYFTLFLAYFMYCYTIFRNSYAIPFYELIADVPKLIFYSGKIETLPYASAYMNLLFLSVTGNIAIFLLILIRHRKGRAL